MKEFFLLHLCYFYARFIPKLSKMNLVSGKVGNERTRKNLEEEKAINKIIGVENL